MRLLERKPDRHLVFREYTDKDVPAYAILSHTWLTNNNEEVSFQDVEAGTAKSKPGWKKIEFCANKAAADDLRYFWIDTCCIDKKNAVELQEAINSMFRWYQKASKCYVYMSDISIDQDDMQYSQPRWQAAFRGSRWFTRGWTLQELIAPPSVEFFCSNGQRLGDKKELALQIHETTGIPVPVLLGAGLSEFDVHERMSWAQDRDTKCPEDMAYSLLGIFGIHMPLIYGEGMLNAFNRLQRELDRRANEQEPDFSRNPILNPHPVKRNYRKVIVMIISWECDRLEMTVQNISNVFRELYHYEVREISLTLEEQHRDNPSWPWPDDIEKTDLQIIYYLGSTRRVRDLRGSMDIQAFPFQKLPRQFDDQISGHRNWLQIAIGIPNLASDVLIVLDCYVEGFSRGSAEEPISILFDDPPWARYGIISAGYSHSSSGPGGFSGRFMSTLEDLAHSGQLVNCASVMRKFMEERCTFEDDIEPVFMGNHGKASIILAPILA
ncbi:MAG: hypothetical protein M1839_004654 [Geoglossum umbratile]|nr:MAG: hypothetical protein M1839_004654 [Geoglossum umbratile]